MTNSLLKAINEKLKSLIPYEYYEWNSKVVYPYWVGEYSEITPLSESGCDETSFIITGTTRNDIIGLEMGREILKNAFPQISGRRLNLDDGTIAVVYYDNAQMISVDDNNIKRIQINLIIKHFRKDI